MKKSLLLFAVTILSSAAAFAQWTKPTLETPAIQGQELVKDGETGQYLYNVERKAFFLGANDWETRASVNDTLGFPVKVIYSDETGGYRINDLVAKFKEWRDMFVETQELIWVDNNNGANHDSWQFEEVDASAFTFKIYNSIIGRTEEEQTYNNEGNPNGYGYLSAPLDINDTRLYLTSWFLADTSRGTGGATWMSVTPEAYEAYIAELKINYADYAEELARYNAAMALKSYLDKAAEEQNGADLSAEIAVYNNNESTIDQLKDALETATQKCVEWSAAQANVENPQDVSDMIENRSFDIQGDFHGWSGTAFGAGGAASTCAEHYEKNYDSYQDVNGGKDIPNGIYKVSVYGFYRAGGINDDYATRDQAEYRHAKLYATSGEDYLYNSIPSLSTWAIESSELGGLQIDKTNLFAPNSMQDFTAWKNAGYGHQVDLIIPVLNNKLRIGAKKETLIPTDWTIFDDFALTYYGNGLDAYQMWRDQVLETIIDDMNTYDWENMYYERQAKTKFEDAVKAARAAQTAEKIHTLTVGITGIVENVLASISAYDDLNKKWDQWSDDIESFGGDLVDAFLNREDEVKDVLENGTKTTEEVLALIAELQEQYDYAVKHSLQEGDDVTNMLTNANFKDGKNGWTNAAGEAFVGTHGGLKAFPAGEVYEDVVDVQQTITDVPAGLYSISVNAFERPAGNGNYTGEEEAKVFLFMGDLQTPVQNIVKDAMPVEEAENYVNCFIEGGVGEEYYSTGGTTNLDYNVIGAGYVPNGMSGASYAFRAGRYVQKCYGLVGDDGIMKIGLTSNGQKAHWVLWSNFKLTFEGKNAEGLKQALAPNMDGLAEWLDNQANDMTANGYLTASARIADVLGTFDDSEDYDVLAALPTEIASIRNYVDENKKLLADWLDAYDAFGEAKYEYGETAAADVAEKADELWREIEASDPRTVESDDETCKNQIQSMNEIIALLRIPAHEEASDENPVDMTQVIVNPNFDAGNYNGWTLVKGEGASGNYQTQNGFDGTTAMEFWSATNGSGTKFNFFQDIANLPAGTYELTVDAANSLNGQNAGPGTGAAYIYAATGADAESLSSHNDGPIEVQEAPCNGDGANYANYSVIFTVAEGDIVRIGAKNVGELSARWVMIDNFILTYYGTASEKAPSTGDETIIKAVDVETAAPAAIFDLAGRRVAKAVKGIYIINGKKVVK